MEKFDFFFGLSLGARILKHADALSTTLQMKGSFSMSSSKNCRYDSEDSRYSIRNDDSFHLFWQRVVAESGSKGVNEPQLALRGKAPRRIEECVSGTAQAEFPTTVEAHRTVYYEALDLVISYIKTRFDQEDYKIHSACESLLLKTMTAW